MLHTPFEVSSLHTQPIVPVSENANQHHNNNSSKVKEEPSATTSRIENMTKDLQSFVIDLEDCFKMSEGKVNPELVKQIFRKHADKIELKDLEQYCFADTKATNTRNLISKNPYFSLIVLVWNPQQHSSIHAHGGSQCWFRCLKGQVKECRWMVDPKHDTSLSPAKPTKEFIANVGAIGFIDDNNGVHSIVNTQDEISVTLHCYAPPYDECACYSEETGEVYRGKVMFDTIGGVVDPSHPSQDTIVSSYLSCIN